MAFVLDLIFAHARGTVYRVSLHVVTAGISSQKDLGGPGKPISCLISGGTNSDNNLQYIWEIR